MPIYEYACKECGHTLDVLQKINDEPLVECPECGKRALRRLISAPRFRLKGEGWYETDFKKDKQRNLLKKDDEAPKKDKSESKSDGAGDKGGKGDKKEKPAKSTEKAETKTSSS